MNKSIVACLGMLGLLAAAPSCSSSTEAADEAPSVDVDTSASSPNAIVYSNGWTLDAKRPVNMGTRSIAAQVVTTGTAGTTRGFGVCALKKHFPAKACNTVNDCFDAPTTLPTGGERRCVDEDGSPGKFCYVLPGPRLSYCMSGYLPPGTYTAPTVAVGRGESVWVSNACFDACRPGIDPSVSSPAIFYERDPLWPGGSK